MYHSTTVLEDTGEMVKEHGRTADWPFSTSILGVTTTVTSPRHSGEKQGHTGYRKHSYICMLSRNKRIRKTKYFSFYSATKLKQKNILTSVQKALID